MTTIPDGSPVWARQTEFGHYGGSVDKKNFLDRGPIDQLTDVGASQFARMTADLVAAARTAPLALCTLGCDDHTPGAPLFGAKLNPSDWDHPIVTGAACHTFVGSRLESFRGDAAPTRYPSASRNGTGDVTVTFPTTWIDPFGIEAEISICHAFATLLTDTDARAVAVPELVNSHTVRVRCFDGLNAPLANASFSLLVI